MFFNLSTILGAPPFSQSRPHLSTEKKVVSPGSSVLVSCNFISGSMQSPLQQGGTPSPALWGKAATVGLWILYPHMDQLQLQVWSPIAGPELPLTASNLSLALWVRAQVPEVCEPWMTQRQLLPRELPCRAKAAAVFKQWWGHQHFEKKRWALPRLSD